MATLVGGKASLESWESQCLSLLSSNFPSVVQFPFCRPISLLSSKEHCLTEDAQAVAHKTLA